MSTQIVELVLRAKNEAAKVFTEVEKTAKDTKKVIDQTVNNTNQSKQPTYFVKLIDTLVKSTKRARELNKNLKETKMFNFNAVTSGIKKMGTELKKTREEAEKVSETFDEITETGDMLVQGSALPTLIATAGATSYANFSRAVSEVNTLLDGTLERQQILESEVLAVSSAYGIDALEVANGYYQAISSGATNSANAVEFLSIAAKTAIGGVTDLGTAVGGIATIVNAFQLEANEAGDAANALFIAVRAGRTTIGELSTSIADAAPLAATLGVEFEELLSAVAALTTAGTPTSQAITQIRSAMDALISQKGINVLFQELGYESSAAAIRAEGLGFALKAVRDAANGSESALIEMLGTQEAMGAVLALTGNQADKFAEIMTSMGEDTTAANRAFAAMDQVFGRTLDKTLTNLANLFVVLGERLAPFATVLLEAVSDLAVALTNLMEEFPTLSSVILGTIAAITLLTTTIGLGLAVVGRLGKGLTLLKGLLEAAAVAFGVTSISAQGLIAVVGRLALALGAVGAGVTLVLLVRDFIRLGWEVKKANDRVVEAQGELWRLQKAFPDANDMNIEAIREYNDLTKEQIEIIQEQQKQRMLINNAEIATLTAQREISAADWDRINALRAQNKIILANDAVLRATMAQRNKDFEKYSNEQLQAEQKRINEAIDGNRKLAKQALIANDPEAVRALNQEYEKYLSLLEIILTQLKANGIETDQVIDRLGLMARGYAQSAEAAADFRTAVESGLQSDFDAAIAQIELIQSGLTSAYDRGAIGAEDFVLANRELAADRLAIERQYEQDLRAQFERERKVREENIKKFSTSEKTKHEDLRKLQRETEQFMTESYRKEAQAAIDARQKAFSEYQKYADKVRSLEDSIAQTQRDKETAIRELRRQGYTDLRAYQDKEREIAELNGKIQQAIDSRNFELAEEYARRQISLAGQLSTEVKENGNVVISEQEAINRAIGGTEQGYDNLSKAQQAQADQARAQAELQLQLYKSLDSTLKGIQKTLYALATGSELVIDIDENTEEVNAAIARYREILDDGATFKVNPEVDSASEDQTARELDLMQKKNEDQYGSVRIATYADTGEFEQEVFTITNGDQYAASVTVKAEDGQYYATVDRLTAEGFIVEGKPTLVQGDLEAYYRDFEASVRKNPPKADVSIDKAKSKKDIDTAVNAIDPPEISTPLTTDTDPAMEQLNSFAEKASELVTMSKHVINVDNSAVNAAKAANANNTSSTHTIYVRRVEQRASGGLMGSLSFPRKSRYISGKGTTTSDDIPAMLSRNEYVHKATAVKKYGLGFMNAINYGAIPKELIDYLMRGGGIPQFNSGGAVGMSNQALAQPQRGLPPQTLNLAFPSGNSVQLQGAPDQVQSLIDELRRDQRQ
ncbi:hypothetical protein 13VO501A_gene0054 [Vibrio phage 13VO501A]|nr:hypothetical protein 13VO501A_gene0054 [Vibrio phage 13VO501A]